MFRFFISSEQKSLPKDESELPPFCAGALISTIPALAKKQNDYNKRVWAPGFCWNQLSPG